MLTFHYRWLGCFALAAFFIACGSKNDTGGQSNTPAPQIVTTSVKEALKGELYSQLLAATGGTAPLVWSLPAEPKEIPWLTIDSSNGALSGTPTESLVPAKSFVVQVKDHDGRSHQKTFTLTVRECNAQNEGHTFPCHLTSDNACFVGTRLCSGGQLGECIVGNGSASTDYCGPDCLACGTSANVCTGGRCFCGTEEPCATTERPDCCYESYGTVCTNLLADPDHCGKCDTNCEQEGLQNVKPACDNGACRKQPDCADGYARCPVGSSDRSCLTNVDSDMDNCGGCGSPCPDLAGKYATSSCQGGQCRITCTDGAQSCDGQIANGCECSQLPVGGSMSCTAAGGCAPQCPAGYNLCSSQGIPTCISNNDLNNCGACERVCRPPSGGSATCNDGKCGEACPSGKELCDHRCVQFPYDVPYGDARIYSCGNMVCFNNRGDCDGNIWNGCEVSLEDCGRCCPPRMCLPNGKGTLICRLP